MSTGTIPSSERFEANVASAAPSDVRHTIIEPSRAPDTQSSPSTDSATHWTLERCPSRSVCTRRGNAAPPGCCCSPPGLGPSLGGSNENSFTRKSGTSAAEFKSDLITLKITQI